VERVVDKNVPMKPRGAAGRPPWMNRQLLREVRKRGGYGSSGMTGQMNIEHRKRK
jgi:hypothetical protein